MFITIIDLALLLVVFLFISFGFFLGFISMIGSLLGLIIGAWAASRYSNDLGDWLAKFLLGSDTVANIIAYLLIFGFVNRLISFGFWFINKVYKLVTIIPLTKTLNRVLGGLLGFVEAVIILEIALYVTLQFNFSLWLAEQLATSSIVVWLISISNWFVPFLPEIINRFSNLI